MVSWVRMKIHFGGMIDAPIYFRQSIRFSELQKFLPLFFRALFMWMAKYGWWSVHGCGCGNLFGSVCVRWIEPFKCVLIHGSVYPSLYSYKKGCLFPCEYGCAYENRGISSSLSIYENNKKTMEKWNMFWRKLDIMKFEIDRRGKRRNALRKW